MKDFLCGKEVASILRIHDRTARRLMASGEIDGFRVGPGKKLWRTTRQSVEEYAARQSGRWRFSPSARD